MKTADLHIHTQASDGAFSAREVLEYAKKVGLTAIGITDHDTVGILPEAIPLSSKYEVEVVPGVEISVDLDEAEIHLLGYYLDYQDRTLLERLEVLKKARKDRAKRMMEQLEKIGIILNWDRLLPAPASAAVGRLHIAQALYRGGYVKSIPEAFQKYIGKNGPAYVPKVRVGKKEAIEMILRLGGVPVLAHPGQLKQDDYIPELVDLGLAGLEVYYPSHTKWDINHYLELARYYGLVVTGGSDCHGTNKAEVLMGTVRIPYELVERLKERAAGIGAAWRGEKSPRGTSGPFSGPDYSGTGNNNS